MKKISIALVLVFVFSVSFASVVIAQMAEKGWEKTVTLPSGEVILDMSEEWDEYVEFLEQLKTLKPVSAIVLITQEGNTFSGVNQSGARFTVKGTQTWEGILDKDGFKEVQASTIQDWRRKWVPVTWKISEHGNKIVFVEKDRVKWTLTRR